MKLALFGDVGAHHDAFAEGLAQVGVDPCTGAVPEDVTVIQVGDLIHKGPDVEQLIVLVDKMMAAAPDRVHMLVGNHEAHHLGGPKFWAHDPPGWVIDKIRSWWTARQLKVAVALDTKQTGPVLVTHAGLVWNLWVLLGRPSTPEQTVNLLGEMRDNDPDMLFAPGKMLAGFRNPAPGPIWASSSGELYGPWLDAPTVPFSQVHGHSSVYSFHSGQFRKDLPAFVPDHLRIDKNRRHVQLVLEPGRCIIGIDPGHGRMTPTKPMSPLVLDGTVTAVS